MTTSMESVVYTVSRPSDHDFVMGEQKDKRGRRVSSGPPTRRRRAQSGDAPKQPIAAQAPHSKKPAVFQRFPHKRRPRLPKGQGLFAGWVRGWGLGGTPPGVSSVIL